jgi:ATP-dependent DNA helicase 2 subunit 2
MSNLRDLRKRIKPSSTNAGDGKYSTLSNIWHELNSKAMSAIIVAIQMISSFCKQLKYTRQIVLVTDGQGAIDADDLSAISAKLKEDNIQLIIL